MTPGLRLKGPAADRPPTATSQLRRAFDTVERVVVVSDDAEASGGAAMMALASIRELAKRGVPVTLLSGEAGTDPMLRALEIDVVCLGGQHLLQGSRIAGAARGLYDQRVARRVRDWITQHDTPGTVYHLNNWHKVLSPSVLHALRAVEPRLVLTAHDFFLACPNGGYFDYRADTLCERAPLSPSCLTCNCDKRNYAQKLWRTARHNVREWAIDLAHGSATVIAVHEGMVPLLARGGISPERIRVLRNPVTPWRNERIAAEANATILCVGRVEYDKGVDVLLRAASRAGCRVVVVGDGPMRATLATNHPEAEFTGRLHQAEIAERAAGARLVVVPTRVRETFGLVALEAAMSGLPVVTTTSALIAGEVLEHGLGSCCPPGDVAALAEVLSRLACDDATVADMSRAAFSCAARLAPTPEQWGDELLSIYRRALAEATN